MSATDARKHYGDKMNEIYTRRDEILTNYFKSIGITKASTQEWNELLAVVQHMGTFTCDEMALK